jgi:hypothetical protein
MRYWIFNRDYFSLYELSEHESTDYKTPNHDSANRKTPNHESAPWARRKIAWGNPQIWNRKIEIRPEEFA